MEFVNNNYLIEHFGGDNNYIALYLDVESAHKNQYGTNYRILSISTIKDNKLV